MANKYDIHPDFAYARFINAPMNRIGVALLNRMNERAIDRMKIDPGLAVEKKVLASTDGGSFGVRIIRPVNQKGPLPCIIHYHGGAFRIKASPFQVHHLLIYAQAIPCVVVMVDYRMTPRYPFPKGFEDAYAALEWVHENSSDIGVDRDWIAVAGDSAGGALAAAVTQKSRDDNGPAIKLQLLLYPVTDYKQDSQSMIRYYDSPIWNAKKNRLMWKAYLKNGIPETIGYASPLHAKSFDGLPEAYIEVAEYDCLRDEGIAYADALGKAGVEVHLNELPGGIHGYDNFLDSQVVDVFVKQRTAFLKKVMASG